MSPVDTDLLLSQFEDAWREGRKPYWLDFVSQANGEDFTIQEILLIDLEYRWRRSAPADPLMPGGRNPPWVEDYATLWPKAREEVLLLEMLSEEYRVRRLFGDRPDRDSYLSRFPEYASALNLQLGKVEQELNEEFPTGSSWSTPQRASTNSGIRGPNEDPHWTSPPPKDSKALLDVLIHLDLLDDPEKTRRAEALIPLCADPVAFCRELLRLGWMTPYQANQILAGRSEGLLLKKYLLLSRLGEGGMGQVFKAKHRKLGRVVALKVIHAERLGDPDAVRRFHREILASGRLSHPHIVLALDADEVNGRIFIAMEYVEGTDLNRRVRERGPLPIEEACDSIRQTARALQHAHGLGMIHRDVKPSNLIRDVRGLVKLLDLGLAHVPTGPFADQSGTLTEHGMILGTPDFVAPEQALDSRNVDARVDLYSLGCTLYFLLSGRVPFPFGSAVEKLRCHLLETPTPIEHLRPEVSAPLAALVRRLMARQPNERFPNAAALLTALDNLSTQETSNISPFEALDRIPMTRPTAPRRPAWRLTIFLMTLGAVSATALVFLLVQSLRPPSTQSDPEPKTRTLTEDAPGPLKEFRDRLRDHPEEQEALRQQIARYRVQVLGTPSAVEAATLLRRIPPPWEARKPQEAKSGILATLGTPSTHWGGIRGLAISPDGTMLASVGEDRVVRILDATTMQERHALLGHGDPPFNVSFSPNGRWIASGSFGDERAVRLWDVAQARETWKVHWGVELNTWQVQQRFMPDGQHLLTSGWEQVTLWNLATRKVVRQFHTRMNWATGLAISPDGTRLATGSNDHIVRIWEVATGKLLEESARQSWHVYHVYFSPDGTQLLSCSGSNLYLLDSATAKELRVQSVYPQTPGSAAFSPEGTRAALALDNGELLLWDLKSGKTQRYRAHIGPTTSVLWPTPRRLYSAGADGIVRAWDPEAMPTEVPNPGGALLGVAFDPVSPTVWGYRLNVGLVAWDLLQEGRERGVAPSPLGERRFALAPESGKAVLFREPGKLFIHDLNTGQDVSLGGALGRCVALAPLGTGLASTGLREDRGLLLHDFSGVKEGKVLNDAAGPFSALAYTQDGTSLVAAGAERELSIYDVATGKLRRRIREDGGKIRALGLSPDGSLAFVAGESGLVRQIWLSGLRPSTTFGEATQPIDHLAVSPTGEEVATVNDRGELKVWDIPTGQRLASWQLPGPIHGAAFSPDARFLATANGNGTATLFCLPERP